MSLSAGSTASSVIMDPGPGSVTLVIRGTIIGMRNYMNLLDVLFIIISGNKHTIWPRPNKDWLRLK